VVPKSEVLLINSASPLMPNVAHGGTIIVDIGTSFNFSGPETFSGIASNAGVKANGDTLVASGNVVSLSMTCPIQEWNHTETKTFTTVDLVPARSMSSNATVEVPVITAWADAGPMLISATTTNPTKGTIIKDKVWIKRNGDSASIRIEFSQSAIGIDGSGDYLVSLPQNLEFDSNKVSF